MAGENDTTVSGLGGGTQDWIAPFSLNDKSGSSLFAVDASGNVTASGTITAGGTQDSNGNFTVTNTAPFVLLADSTASAKQLKIKCDANLAQLRETGGADGSLLVLDLANARVGVATASPTVALDVTGAAHVSTNLVVDGTVTATGNLTASASVIRASQKRIFAGPAKVGTTAGWTVNAASDVGIQGTCPASQTASTLIIPLTGFKVGDTITGFQLAGAILSGGNTVTVDCDLRKLTAASGATMTDASVATMTQISVTASVALDHSNSLKSGLSTVVLQDCAYYLKVTVTTGSSCSVVLGSANVIVTES